MPLSSDSEDIGIIEATDLLLLICSSVLYFSAHKPSLLQKTHYKNKFGIYRVHYSRCDRVDEWVEEEKLDAVQRWSSEE